MMMKSTFAIITLLLCICPLSADQSFYRFDFKPAENNTPRLFSRAGDNPDIAVLKTFDNGNHALAVEDQSENSYGQWHSQHIALPASARKLGYVTLRLREMYHVDPGHEMRLTIIFYDNEEQILTMEHLLVRNDSPDWSSRDWTFRERKFPVPDKARTLTLSLVSGGPAETMGAYYLDDLELLAPPDLPDGRHVFTPLITWDMETPSSIRDNCPQGWEMAGALPIMAAWSDSVAVSGSRSLHIADTDDRKHALWCSRRVGFDIPPRRLELSCAVKIENLKGVMTLAIAFYHVPAENNYSPVQYRIDGEMTIIGDSLHIAWFGHEEQSALTLAHQQISLADADEKGFVRIQQGFTVPDYARCCRVALLSGWEPRYTGRIWIDDISIKTSLSPPQE